MVTMPPLVVRMRASSTVLVKASSLVNRDLGAMVACRYQLSLTRFRRHSAHPRDTRCAKRTGDKGLDPDIAPAALAEAKTKARERDSATQGMTPMALRDMEQMGDLTLRRASGTSRVSWS